MPRFYFTYGSSGQPYAGGWTEVEAQDKRLACAAFRAYHPDKTEGLLKGLPVNPIGSWLYGMQEHGQPIVGTIVLLKDEGHDIVGLNDEDVDKLAVMLSRLKCRLAWGRI